MPEKIIQLNEEAIKGELGELAGVSVRHVEDITEALWGSRVSAGTVSKLNKKVYVKIEEWRQRELLVSAQEDKEAALEKTKSVVQKLKEMKLPEAAKKVESSVAETLSYMDFPS